MKKFYFLAFAAIFFHLSSSAQTTYRSVQSGLWNVISTWEISVSGPGGPFIPTTSGQTPGAGSDVIIQNGHTVSLDASGRNCNNLTINSGGRLSGGTPSPVAERTLRINGSTLLNNGTLGAPAGQFDVLTIELNSANANNGFTITGSGYSNFCRLRMVGGNLGTDVGGPSANPVNTVTIDQDLLLQIGLNGVSTSYGLALVQGPANTDNYIITINSGKTVKITGGHWHNSGASSGSATASGNYTYNIHGTLDLSTTTSSNNSNFIASSDASKTLTVNLTGTLKLPTNGTAGLSLSEGIATGQAGSMVFNVSGMLDGSNAPINTSTTTLPTRKFSMTGNGTIKRTVGNADVLFAVGIANSYNPVTINNSGTTDGYTVSLSSTVSNSGAIIDVTKIVNKQWTIVEAVPGGSNATLSLGWVTADQAAGFVSTNPVVIGRWNGTAWNYYNATVSGSGTTADPYIASATGITADFTSANPFIVANKSALPVNIFGVKAFTKETGVQVEWSVGTEYNVASYILERAINSRDFATVATVAAKGNSSYSAYDANPVAGVNYYRLKVLDKDGSFKYSTVLAVNISKTKAEVVVAPNPVKGGQLNLQIGGLEKGVYSVRLYNDLGQEVFNSQLSTTGGSLSQSFTLPSTVKAGMYNLQLSGGDVKISKRVVVQ